MNEIINKTDGTILKWSKTTDNNFFCLLYSDNKNNYSFTPTTNLNCKLFMIGGGGAGGYYFGGGGGAGSAYYNDNFTFKQGITYNFTIGNGGKCDIEDINSLFSSGLSLNIYNNVNIDFNNISFALDDYSTLNINNSGLIQNFIVNTYDTNITIPNSIWNNNTFYIWSGYIIPNGNDEYIKININTNINTAIWVDNYMYTNDNALILNTNNNYLNDVKIIKIDPKRFYNIKIISYCNNNSSNNNFSISFSNNCSLSNYNKNNEKYIYLNATDTTLNFNDGSLENSINTFTCSGGGNGGCGFYNKNTNLDGGCGGGSGINKINGKTTIKNGSIYKGTDGAIGTFCGGGGGILSTGKDNLGGDGMILDWFDNKLFFGCGGNGGNHKDNRNYGYGCGGNGGDCCYYSKEIINNNGKNGCVLIYINSYEPQTLPPTPTQTPTSAPVIENFTDYDYNYILDPSNNNKLEVVQIYQKSLAYITDFNSDSKNQYKTSDNFRAINNQQKTYAGFVDLNYSEDSTPNSLKDGIILTYDGKHTRTTILNSSLYYNDSNSDTFFKYFKFNSSYIYHIICFHKCIIALYKIIYYIFNNTKLNINNITTITFTVGNSGSTNYSNGTINLHNIFKINTNSFTCEASKKFDYLYNINNQQYANFYLNSSGGLGITPNIYSYKYEDSASIFPPLPYYNIYNNTGDDNTSYLKELTYIKEYLSVDFINSKLNSGNTATQGTPSSSDEECYDNSFLYNNLNNANSITIDKVKGIIPPYNDAKFNRLSKLDREMLTLYASLFAEVLDPTRRKSLVGNLYYYAHYFNLIILNLNLQYGLYRTALLTLCQRPYICVSAIDNTAEAAAYTSIGTGNTLGTHYFSEGATAGTEKSVCTTTLTQNIANSVKPEPYYGTVAAAHTLLTQETLVECASSSEVSTDSDHPVGKSFLKYTRYKYNTTVKIFYLNVNTTTGQDPVINGNNTLTITKPTVSSIIVTSYNNNVTWSGNMIEQIFNAFKNLNQKDTSDLSFIVNTQNKITTYDHNEAQLRLNKTIKKYNDELQVYNTTLNIYKSIVVICIVLLIIIVYIFTLNSNILKSSSKISLFIILAFLILGICIYFAYNTELLYENFTNDNNNDRIIENFYTSSSLYSYNSNYITTNGIHVEFCRKIINALKPPTTLTDADAKTFILTGSYKNLNLGFEDDYKYNYQGIITNYVYLAGIVGYNYTTDNPTNGTAKPVPLSAIIDFTIYVGKSKNLQDLLIYYINGSYNTLVNSAKNIDTVSNLINYKNKRIDYYENRYEFYLNSIEALKNEKYVYYYLSILYALCIILLLISLIIILIFGHNINSIIITTIVSFLIALVIVFYIYFKLHHHTRTKVDKNYWAYNNPSNDTLSSLSNSIS
jgi:hypothetical protein